MDIGVMGASFWFGAVRVATGDAAVQRYLLHCSFSKMRRADDLPVIQALAAAGLV